MISITVSPKTVHHALKAAWPLLAGGMLVPTYHQPWWVIGLGMASIFFGVFTLMLGIAHSFVDCSFCKARPRERLTRPHYQLWSLYGRYGWGSLTLVTLSWIVITAFDQDLVKHDSQTIPARVFWTILVTLIVMYVSARRFTALNYGFARPRPIRHFVQTYCLPLMHKSQALIIVAMVLNLLALALLPRKGPGSLFGVGMSMMLYGAVYLALRHAATLCEKCVEEVEIPIDAAEQAARNRWRFTVLHRSGFALPLTALGAMLLPYWLPLVGDVVVQAVFDAVLVSGMLLAKYHSSYQPWCPYCRGGGGGHDEDEVVPDPSPDQGRPLPV